MNNQNNFSVTLATGVMQYEGLARPAHNGLSVMRGAVPGADGNFELPCAPLPRPNLADVPSRKRANAQHRYEHAQGIIAMVIEHLRDDPHGVRRSCTAASATGPSLLDRDVSQAGLSMPPDGSAVTDERWPTPLRCLGDVRTRKIVPRATS